MEHESFEDEAIAALMNQRFINIKVDREERPDLDQIYQLVVQLMRRSGGWPLTVFLTPDQRPFFAGTYFPPHEKYGMPGFPQVLTALADAYATQRGEVEEQAQEITQAIGRVQRSPAGTPDVGPDVLERAARPLTERFDERHGGFGARPKFPNTMALDILLRVGTRGDGAAQAHVELALDRMRAGGIWDPTSAAASTATRPTSAGSSPHFEKMLYDNALLLRLYVDGFRAFGTPAYAETAREIVAYLFAEMRDTSGGLFASQDADSEGHEGTFFVWTPSDLEAAVSAGTAREAGAPLLRHHARRQFREERRHGPLGGDADRARRRRARCHHGRGNRGPRRSEAAHAHLPREARAPHARRQGARELERPPPRRARRRRPRPRRALVGRRCAEGLRRDHREAGRDGRVGRYFKDGVAESDRPGFLDDQAYLGKRRARPLRGHRRSAATPPRRARSAPRWSSTTGDHAARAASGSPPTTATR